MAATLTRCFHVSIKDDRKLTLAFLDWCMAERIYTLRGTGGATGPDFVSQTYPLHHAERIERWIIDNEGRPE